MVGVFFQTGMSSSQTVLASGDVSVLSEEPRRSCKLSFAAETGSWVFFHSDITSLAHILLISATNSPTDKLFVVVYPG